MLWSQKIILARERLGLSQLDVSRETGITISEICDIEDYDNEIYSVSDIEDVKKLLTFLKLNFMDFFNIKCVFCSGKYSVCECFFEDLFENKMNENSLTIKKLANSVGFEEIVIKKIKYDKSYLSKWSLELVKDFSEAIDIPIQILLDLKCPKCKKKPNAANKKP